MRAAERYARVLFAGQRDAGEVGAAVDALLSRAPRQVRLATRAGCAAAAVASRLPGGIERLSRLHPAAGLLDDAMKSIVMLAAGGQENAGPIQAAAQSTEPARPDALLDVTPAEAFPSQGRCDVAVVGSGAGGAIAAMVLAEAGVDVIVVEEGHRWRVDDFRRGAPLDRWAGLYRDAGTTVALGAPPVVLPVGRAVGGTTVVNSGTCFEPPVEVLRHWRSRHGLDRADPDTFRTHVDAIWELLQVGPSPPEVLGANARVALDGAAALGWSARPLDRNAPGCGGCCQCAIGCPRNAKYGVHLNALPAAVAAGARIVSGLRVKRVLDEPTGARLLARRADGSAVELRADQVLVAAGATETPPLLRRSGFRHPRLGANLAIHPALALAGLFPEPVRAWEGVLQSAAIEEHHRHGILIEATATPPGMGSMILPGHGEALAWWLDRQDRLAFLGAMVADSGNGKVRPFAGETLITYRLGKTEEDRLRQGMLAMGKALFAAGAEAVVTGIAGSGSARSLHELAEQVATLDRRRFHLAAFHPSGTAAAGADPQRHPVGTDGKLRGAGRIWVADASLLPSSPEVNPQVTIMALARSVATDLARR